MSDQQLLDQNITWDAGLDPITESQYASIVSASPVSKIPAQAAVLYSVLKARHILYWHSAQNMPSYHNGVYVGGGDCGHMVGPTGNNETLIGKYLGLAASKDPEPISQTIISVASKIFGIFGASHARAVALEQNDICQLSNQINAALDSIDYQVQQGSLSLADASTALAFVKSTAHSIVAPVTKSTGGKCNAACVEMEYLDGLIALREKYLYPSISVGTLGSILPKPISQIVSEVGQITSGTLSAFSGGSIKVSNNAGLLIFLFLLTVTIAVFKMRGKAHA